MPLRLSSLASSFMLVFSLELEDGQVSETMCGQSPTVGFKRREKEPQIPTPTPTQEVGKDEQRVA